MFSGDYPLNCWYVAGRAEDFDHSLRALRLFGRDIVFYRGASGAVMALEDACPHRKLPLSMGTLDGDRVVCGYHGLTFDGRGVCVAAPTQPDAIPNRARVRSYAVLERYGFVWVWPGAAKADPDAMLDIPNFDDPDWGKTARGALSIGCNYLWVVDNLLDPSHVAWVHLTSFAGAGTDNAPLELYEGVDRVVVSRWIYDAPASPYYQPFLKFDGNCDRKQHYECRLPAIAINGSVYTPVGTGGQDEGLPAEALRNFSYNFMTPVDDSNTLYFWFQHCNAIPGSPDMAERMFAGATMAFNEDKLILEAVQRGMAAGRDVLNLGLDAGAMRFRRLVTRMIAAERG
jgi:phenylpropionate dioxygenase-like ring-hydroxylating dioxygenase large terminal subunit